MAELTIPQQLRAAAAKLREAAKNATSGPWIAYATPDEQTWTFTRPYCDDGSPHACEPDCGVTVLTIDNERCQEGDVRWVELMAPHLAEPLAELLEHIGDDMEGWDAHERQFPEHVEKYQVMVCDGRGVDRLDWTAALVVARAVNGAPAPVETTPTYLVWSNNAGSWWGPNGAGYTGDVWSAGRYGEREAIKACSMRTWSQGAPPPEVMVLAPEHGRGVFTVEDIRAVPELMHQRIAEATRKAIAERKTAGA